MMIHSPASIIPPGFTTHALELLQRVQHGTSPVELIYTAHKRWPLRPGYTTHAHSTLHISVLDSSFNPPTLAHLALANSLPPSSSRSCPASTLASVEQYDARILLLSVRNADKVLQPGDATFVQRLEMMRLLSDDMSSIDTAEPSGESSQTSDNVAVAIIDEPTFVGKSTVLLRFLRTRLATVIESSPRGISDKRDASHILPSPTLTFLLGFDTLVRIFSPKYYSSEQAMVQMLRAWLSADQEDCRIVCAHRQCPGSDETFRETQDRLHEFIKSDHIAFIDIGAEEQTYSSSKVRTKAAAGDEKWKQLVTNVMADYIIERDIYSGSKEREK